MELGTLRLPTRAEESCLGNISGLHQLIPRVSLSPEGSRDIAHGEEHREGVVPNWIRVETAAFGNTANGPMFFREMDGCC